AQDAGGSTTQQTINFNITQNLAIVPPTPALGTVGEPFNLTLAAVNGTSPFTFQVLHSSLPNGLSLASTGAITGTPASAATVTTQIQVTDSSPVPQIATLPITLQIGNLQVTPASLTLLPGAVGQTYADSVEMANGFGPFVPTVVQGSLPPGLTAATGSATSTSWLISGTPTAAGTFSFSVLLTDSEGVKLTQPFVLVVNPFAITPPVLFSGVEGRGYDLTLATQGGTAPFTFVLLTGSLPPGLTLNPATGEITGVPAPGSAGTYTLGLQATDTNGLKASQSLSLVIFSGTTFAITTTGLPSATGGQNYQQTIAADFGTPPYTFTVSNGTLPSGLSLAPNGILQGIPDPSQPGSFSFTVQVTDAQGLRARQSFRLVVDPPSSSQ
ncbi:MAG: Ig domain-containing protein, partial [Terriglobales bacterium]